METYNPIVIILFIIFAGTAILSTMALYARQSLLVAYILLGMILGPGLKLVYDSAMLREMGDVGVIFLLFLLGLHLHPQNLLRTLSKVSWITIVSSLIFGVIGWAVTHAFGYNNMESAIVGVSLMFSSTIIGLKLLPTTVLHHQHTGELMISILLAQDIIAILVLLFLQGAADTSTSLVALSKVIFGLPVLLLVAYYIQKYLLTRLLSKFDRYQEYIFLVAIGWCLSLSVLARLMGLSDQIGAFIAGVALATNPISFYIAESLKPLRDFFLVIFFFSIGADFNFGYLSEIVFPAIILTILVLLGKPLVFRLLLKPLKEESKVAWEVSVRLAQASEFSLLVVYLAASTELISQAASSLVQACTILTFVFSCYWVVLRYPTPMGATENLKRD